MVSNDLLIKVLTGPMDENLRNELMTFLVLNSGNKTTGIPRLKDCQSSLNSDAIYARLKTAAGGTGVSVAKVLGITSQGFNNQFTRKAISGNSIIDFHLKTGISVDWLIGSWDGNSSSYVITPNYVGINSTTTSDQPKQKYLSLVETYDQSTGNAELKWCVTKHRVCFDDDNLPITGDFSALLSIIIRYKEEAGTPDKVKNGGKQHFQVRRVLAYVLGDPKLISHIDGKAKYLTSKFISGNTERAGKTEFRLYSSKDECLSVFSMLAEQQGVSISRPEFDAIAWDLLIGAGSISPLNWIISRLPTTYPAE